jgi:plasmid maintenance system antidote protein VapI
VAADVDSPPTVLTNRPRRKFYVTAGRIPVPDNAEEIYVGNRLKEIIEYKGWRLPWLADRLGYHRTYLARMIDGERELTRPFIIAVCEFLDLPPDAVFIRAQRHD